MLDYGWHDLVGNIGVVGVLTTYLLVQMGRLHIRNLSYSLINGACALLIIVSLLVDFNLSSFIIEIAWFLISLLGVVNYFRLGPPEQEPTPSGPT